MLLLLLLLLMMITISLLSRQPVLIVRGELRLTRAEFERRSPGDVALYREARALWETRVRLVEKRVHVEVPGKESVREVLVEVQVRHLAKEGKSRRQGDRKAGKRASREAAPFLPSL